MFNSIPTLAQIQSNLQNIITGSDEFYQQMENLNKLSKSGNIDAQIFEAWVYSQRGALKDFAKKAFSISQITAQNSGHPAAYQRMADLLLWGVGIEKNEAKCFQIYLNLSSQGYVPLTTLAYLHSQGIGTKVNELEASSLILKAAAQGDTLAFALLSYRYEIGLGVPLSALLACSYAILAEKRLFPGSQKRIENLFAKFPSVDKKSVDEMVLKLISNIESLDEQVQLLSQRVSPRSPDFHMHFTELLSTNLALLNMQELSCDENIRGYHLLENNFNLPQEKIISESPRLRIYKNFASFEECMHLINQAQPILRPTQQLIKNAGLSEIDAFSGESVILSNSQVIPVERVIQARFSNLCNTPLSHFEPVSILKYSRGHEYTTHTDAFDESRIKKHESLTDFGGQRMTTNLLYLLPAIKGGQTRYESINHTITGEIGTAIVHYNATDDFIADERSFHTGIEILEGEKWLLRTATRQNPLYGENQI